MKLASQRLFTIIFAISTFFSLSAFRHTDVEGFTDPDFEGYQFRTVVVQLPNASLDFKRHIEKQFSKHFKKRGIRVLFHDDLFAPTREWDVESTAAVYQKYDVDAGLIITIGNAGSDESPGMIMYNATTTGSVTTGYATQVSVLRDHVSFDIALVDAESHRTAWIGELSTRGAGMLFVGPKSTAKGLAKGLLKELQRAGHVRNR